MVAALLAHMFPDSCLHYTRTGPHCPIQFRLYWWAKYTISGYCGSVSNDTANPQQWDLPFVSSIRKAEQRLLTGDCHACNLILTYYTMILPAHSPSGSDQGSEWWRRLIKVPLSNSSGDRDSTKTLDVIIYTATLVKDFVNGILITRPITEVTAYRDQDTTAAFNKCLSLHRSKQCPSLLLPVNSDHYCNNFG